MLIDFHAHILPGADHGCDHISMALKQLELARRAGVDVVVATPHFYPNRHTVEGFCNKQKSCAEQLYCELIDDSPKVLLGAEVLVCAGMERMPNLDKLCIQGTNQVILLELPTNDISDDIFQTIFEIERAGYQPIIAHLDRYNSKTVNGIRELGTMAQLNADSFVSLWKRKTCMHWVETENVWAIGSDIHGTQKGYKDFKHAVNILGKYADPLMERTRHILNL